MRIWLALLGVVACSDSPSSMMIDAPPSQPDAFDAQRCLIKGAYGALGSLTGMYTTMSGTGATITLDAGPPRDTLFVKFVTGKGAFSAGVMPGTYTIAGADAGYNTCGLCVHIIADIVTGVGPTKFYLADAGTVTLTSTNQPIMGSAQNLHFVEVDIGSGTRVPGCEGSIDSVTFATN